MPGRVHLFASAHDKNLVSPFLQNAEEIYSTAREAGPEDCEMSILVSRDGSIHMLAGEEWALEPLRLHHGARAAYHVSRKNGEVKLEARSMGESCRFESRPKARILSVIAPDLPQYLTL